MSQSSKSTITDSLNAKSNRAVSTLLAKGKHRIQSNRKRIRSELNDNNSSESPLKKRKIDIKPLSLTIQTNNENDNENDNEKDNKNVSAFGFSSESENDNNSEIESENINENYEFKKEETDDDFDIDLFNNNRNNTNNNSNNNINNNLNESNNSLQNDPYWNMMTIINKSNTTLMDLDDSDESINDNSNNKNKKNESNISIQIDVGKGSVFEREEINNKNDPKKKKKEVRKYQKWQRDQGIECTRGHLALLVYRARFRTLLCTDCELIARMMSIVPLHLHPLDKDFNGIYTEITFKKLRDLMRWFVNIFQYDNNVKQFELGCRKPKDRIPCGLFQLIEYIEDVGDRKHEMKCSISHLNMLFLTLLWSFNISARMVYVLRPISHNLTTNKIYDNNYNEIMNTYFRSKPCVCQQLDDDDIIILDNDYTIQILDENTNNSNNTNNKRKKQKNVKDIDDINMVNGNENSGTQWEPNDDVYLYNNRDNEVDVLAVHFQRTRTAIRNRLEHILDPTHDAYKQLHGDKPPLINDKDKAVTRRKIKINVDINCMDIDDNEGVVDSDETITVKTKKKSDKKTKKTKKKSGKKNKKSFKKPNSNKKWTVDDDIYLWEYRDDPVDTLAQTFNRTKTAIKRRLEILRDPSSKWRKRLIKNLPASSKSKLLSDKKVKLKTKPMMSKRPYFNYLGQNFVYNAKGSMVECIEVYVSDRKEWVHILLDRGRIHIDLCENNLHQCDCEKSNNKMNYCITVDKYGGVFDVTPRYAEIWSVALKNRVMHNDYYNDMVKKWMDENEQISYQYGWQYVFQHELWKDLLKKDMIQIEKCIKSEPIPKSEGMFRNHPLFVIEKFLKKYETIYPMDESQVIGKIKGQNVYSIENLRDLHTRERWYKLGYVVNDDAQFVKQVKTSHMSKSENEFTDLFGKWQCKKYIAPTIGAKDKLPVNSRGNIELWSDLHLPIGCVHIERQGAVFAAKRMKIEYAKAMVGFDQRKGRSVPVFDGIVIHKSYENELNKIIGEMDIKRKEREKEKEMKNMCALWRVLVQGIIVQQQLETQAREKEANKKIVTTKEFNSKMNKDNVEDL